MQQVSVSACIKQHNALGIQHITTTCKGEAAAAAAARLSLDEQLHWGLGPRQQRLSMTPQVRLTAAAPRQQQRQLGLRSSSSSSRRKLAPAT
jgi:hypothetical protein